MFKDDKREEKADNLSKMMMGAENASEGDQA